MKRTKLTLIIIAVVTALVTTIALTMCDTPVSKTPMEPGDTVAPSDSSSITTSSTTTESNAKATPTATATTSATATSATTAATTTAEATTKATENSEGSSSGSGDSGSGSGSSSSEGSSLGGSSSGGGNATVPTTPPAEKPTEPTSTTASSKYVAHLGCGSCGCETLVDTPHYHYTTPEQTHQETSESWDYGIQHYTVKINWKEQAYALGDAPSISEDFEVTVDTDGNRTSDFSSAQYDAEARAMDKAKDWLSSVGVSSAFAGYYSSSTITGSLEQVGYEVTTITVVDEPEHEYEVGAYICDTCGAVETYGTPTQIR